MAMTDSDDELQVRRSKVHNINNSLELRRSRPLSSRPKIPTNLPRGDFESEDDLEADKEELHGITRSATRSKAFIDEEEKTVIRKLDKKLVLFLALLYMLSFLDRSNIGNARIAGLETDLELSSSEYEWLLTAFYITYIAFEWMTLLYRIVPPHIYISTCVFAWGTLASLQAVATSFASLVVLRVLLGVAEAAFGPGVPFYLTFFYKRSELAYRVGLFIAAAPLAVSFASSLAWVIVKISDGGPLQPWRALFLIEGFPSVIVAVIAFYAIPDSPSTVRYLTSRERKVAKIRLQDQDTSVDHATSHGINFREVLQTLCDPKAYLTALMFFSANVSFSSLPVFLPTIITDMAFSPLASQALAAPPYLAAFVLVLTVAHYSDKIPDSRAYFILAVALLSSASYATIAIAGYLHESLGERATLGIRYAGVYGAAMGFFCALTLIITWTLNNQASASGKATGMTILNVIGQMGPLVGVRLFPKSDGPFYVRGMTICASFMLAVAALAIGLRWHLGRLNRELAKKMQYEMVEMNEEGAIATVNETLMGSGEKKMELFRFML